MKSMVRKVLLFAVVVCVTLLMTFCASISMPTGGPKDVVPPKVVKSVPENNSTHFQGRKIEILFDEYVILDNATQNILVSPPLKNKPDVKTVGKSVVIRFKDELEPNTTYNISFGSAIHDYRENNVLNNHTFTFSTGDYVDSLSISGVLLGATDKKPVENAFVTLYDASLDNLDSLPMLSAPNQVVRTDKNGKFRFSGLADKEYLVFALKDMNGNYYYDQPNEDVAFVDTLVRAVYDGKIAFDSTASDSIRPIDRNALDLKLFLFTTTDTTQMLHEKKLVEPGLLRFVLRQPDSSLCLSYLTPLPDTLHHIGKMSATHDTLFWYFTPNAIDSATFLITDKKGFADTVKMNLKAKTKNLKLAKLDVKNNLKKGLLMPEEPFTLVFSEPIIERLPSDSLFVHLDSVTSIPATFVASDSSHTHYVLQYEPVEGDSLSLHIPDSLFIGIRGCFNDKMTIKFHRAKEEEYGNLFIKVVPPEGVPQIIVELLNESGKIIDTQVVKEQRELEYWYLSEGKYKLRATFDVDGNGRWSSGDYTKRFQPEKVVEYKTTFDVRAGWDIDLDDPWVIGE